MISSGALHFLDTIHYTNAADPQILVVKCHISQGIPSAFALFLAAPQVSPTAVL